MTAPSPPLDRTNVAALIPAYREEKHIADVVRRTRAQLDHVFVVDDGSPDSTAAVARDAGAELLRHDVNRGKGAAIKTGLRELAARGFISILILDADGQHCPEEIPRFLAESNSTGARMILGNRMSDLRTMPFLRKMTNRCMSWQISRICRQPIPDTQCGFRLIHRDLVPDLLCKSEAFDYETEMLFVISARGVKVAAVPISTVYGDEKSKIRPVRDTFRFLRLLSRYRSV
jgi:glycosyltransferase involved in cell wall biosynthesis